MNFLISTPKWCCLLKDLIAYFSNLLDDTINCIKSEFNEKCFEFSPEGAEENNSGFPYSSYKKKKEGSGL